MHIFRLFSNNFFVAFESQIYYIHVELQEMLFLNLFCLKRTNKEISNFWLKPWTNPYEIMHFSIVFFFQLGNFALREWIKNFLIFNLTHGLTPLGKSKFCYFLKSIECLERQIFIIKHHQTRFLSNILLIRKKREITMQRFTKTMD